MCGVMTQINRAELPDELVNLEILAQVSELDGALNEFDQHAAKLGFHFQNLVPDAAVNVIELEQTRGHRTAAGQAGALRPAEPVAHQRAQAGRPSPAVIEGRRTCSITNSAICVSNSIC